MSRYGRGKERREEDLVTDSRFPQLRTVRESACLPGLDEQMSVLSTQHSAIAEASYAQGEGRAGGEQGRGKGRGFE